MSAFDPTPGQPYGRCGACSIAFETEDAANEHMRRTFDEAKARGDEPRSHSVRITNPPRAQRIRRRVASIVDDALDRAMDDLEPFVARGDLTEAEVTDALRNWPDFGEAWEDYIAGGAS